MIKKITGGWNLMRVLRLVMGIAVIVQGIRLGEYLVWIAGSFLVLSAVFNYGCCGNSGCPVPPFKKYQEKTK
jgi:hypothetical protein